jgi:hypothetical protein
VVDVGGDRPTPNPSPQERGGEFAAPGLGSKMCESVRVASEANARHLCEHALDDARLTIPVSKYRLPAHRQWISVLASKSAASPTQSAMRMMAPILENISPGVG